MPWEYVAVLRCLVLVDVVQHHTMILPIFIFFSRPRQLLLLANRGLPISGKLCQRRRAGRISPASSGVSGYTRLAGFHHRTDRCGFGSPPLFVVAVLAGWGWASPFRLWDIVHPGPLNRSWLLV